MKRVLTLLSLLTLCSLVFAWDLVRQASFPINFFTLEAVGTDIWAGGSGGGVAKSVDGGTSWNFVETPFFDATTAFYRTIEDISFATEELGVIVGAAELWQLLRMVAVPGLIHPRLKLLSELLN